MGAESLTAFSRPVPATEIATLLEAGRGRLPSPRAA
jgi:hypothetical protein